MSRIILHTPRPSASQVAAAYGIPKERQEWIKDRVAALFSEPDHGKAASAEKTISQKKWIALKGSKKQLTSRAHATRNHRSTATSRAAAKRAG